MPVAFANRRKVDRLGVAMPLSRRAMVDCDVPILSACSALGQVGVGPGLDQQARQSELLLQGIASSLEAELYRASTAPCTCTRLWWRAFCAFPRAPAFAYAIGVTPRNCLKCFVR